MSAVINLIDWFQWWAREHPNAAVALVGICPFAVAALCAVIE